MWRLRCGDLQIQPSHRQLSPLVAFDPSSHLYPLVVVRVVIVNGDGARRTMSTASSSRLPPPTSHTTLILPFTPATYTNPSVLLPTIFRVLDQCTTTSLLVLFSTPPSPESRHAHDTQLYTRLARDPQGNWAGFQTFLGKVYACLAAAQWSGGNVLMDVEVDFEGEADAGKGIVNGRIKSDEGDSQVVKIQGVFVQLKL